MLYIAAVRAFLAGEEAQDLAEYCLITALVVLVAGAALVWFGGPLQNLWGGANHAIDSAGAASGGPAPGAGTAVPRQ
jgi:Flp pilus assembly pilin Flp